ncbi:hypothetical protein TCAL_15332, partial [Tigriopus californicus]
MSFEKHNTQLSKALSWLLRHNLLSQGLTCSPEGFVDVDSVLRLPKFRQYTVSQVQDVVRLNDKQRFALRTDPHTGALQIRANQGHTIEHISPDLKAIKDATLFPVVIHGTYMKAWPLIQAAGGLSRMRRNHIHFAPGLPDGTSVISGMRKNCDVHIYVDLNRALQDGFEFFESANGVILCPGNDERGVLPSTYFKKVIQVKQGKIDLQ